ncbi:hypothetical protein TcWFU_010142 [Taenia crassiceps]|uniref:KASH domain-containing protein n=1 Tax=Taenia crassiceps TaxID=6207 RepID=A0ABR4QIJ8_9CEST
MGDSVCCCVDSECDEFPIPDNILLSESFKRLSKECKSAVRKLTEVSEKQDKSVLNFMPFAKVTFDFQNEAHRLLSWLKLAAKTIQNKPFDRRSVQSLLIYKEYTGVFASLESSYRHVQLFTEQLSLFARPVSLSVTLPFWGDTTPKSSLPNPPFSPRTVLVKDYAQILKQVDSFWARVGSQLRSFGENVNETVVLTALQNEVSVLLALVTEVTEKTDNIYQLTWQNLAGPIDKTAYKALKVEHLKLKKISRRLDNVRELMSHLGGGKTEKPWFDPSVKADIVTSAEGKVSDLVNSVHEVWLKQLELREVYKLTSASKAPNQPSLVEATSSKPNSNSASLSTSSNAAPHARGGVGGLCCWRQRLRASKSDSCLPCMRYLRQSEGDHYHHCRHFTASGESGFVSGSDNARRRRHRYQHIREPAVLAEQRIRHNFRSLSFPLPINLLRCLLNSQPSESSKDESSTSNQVSSFEECTPTKAKQYHYVSENAAFLFPPHFSLNPGTVHYPIAISPIYPPTRKHPRDCDLVADERTGSSLQPCDSTFSVLSSTNVDDDDDVENAIGAALTAGEEDDSALVTSPTSYSFPHDTDDEVNESGDDELFAHLYLGNQYKGRRCLSRSLPSLLDKRPVCWSMLRSLEESADKRQQQSQQQHGESTTEDAYVPIVMLSEEAEDEVERGDTTLGVESHLEVGAGDACSRLVWSPLSCCSEDLASLAAALRLSPADSEKLSEVLRDGSEVINWLLDLEASLYVPTNTSGMFSTDLLCRLRPELSRVELDKRLSELQYYAGRLECWRRDVDTLIVRHKARLLKLEPQANKLLASDHGFLAFFPSWLDMIASRRSEVDRELRSQVRLLDYINCVSSDTKKKLQEIENQAGPAMSEAQCVVEQLAGENIPAIDATDCYQPNGSYFRRSAPNIPALTERLQDLLERASELDPRSNLLRQPSIEALSDNQILRARLRSSLARLHSLSSSPSTRMASQHQRTPDRRTDVSFPLPSLHSTLRWNPRNVLCVTLLLAILSLFCYASFQPGWYSTEEVRQWCNRDHLVCFASVWSRSLCIAIPSLSSSSAYCFHPPPT